MYKMREKLEADPGSKQIKGKNLLNHAEQAIFPVCIYSIRSEILMLTLKQADVGFE